jgi:hypothetical protein
VAEQFLEDTLPVFIIGTSRCFFSLFAEGKSTGGDIKNHFTLPFLSIFDYLHPGVDLFISKTGQKRH